VARASELEAAREHFASDYETLLRLGKAIPSSVDIPSLLLQLDSAARGTGIDFLRISPGERLLAVGAGATPAPGSAPAGAPAGASTPAPAGGAAAAPAPAAGAAPPPPAPAPAAAPGAATPSDTQTSRPAGAAPAATATSGLAGLDTVPLDIELSGDFFDLADFFHRQKRFVQLRGERILVEGRLISVDSFSLSPQGTGGKLSVQMQATIYLSPRAALESASASGAAPAPATPGATPSTGGPPAAAVVR
jgi:Tfp pilus assembly protein PilO